MQLPKLSVKKPVTITMVALIIIILGFVSFGKLSTELFPKMDMPYAIVVTNYYGASPEEIENIVTKNMEDALATVENVKTFTSVSSENNSMIAVEFNEGTNMDVALMEMRENVDMISSYLPDGVEKPMILKLNPNNLMPVMGFSVTYEDKDLAEVTEWVEDTLVPRLERVEGIATVGINGGTTSQIEVTLKSDITENAQVEPSTIVQMLQAQNFNLPAGTFTEEGIDYTIRAIGEFESIDDIRNLPIQTPMGLITLSDIADVTLVNESNNTYSKVNGEDSITVTIQRQNNANISDVAKGVDNALGEIEEEEENASFVTVFNQADYIEQSVSSVSMNAVIGAVLAIFILFIFLKDIRPTIIIGIAIPISIITTFIFVYFLGVTLNVVSLGGLALGIGMLVDNSIVVLENVFRLRKEGKSRKDAAIEGTAQVGGAIIASTLTTVSVFLPVVFVEGLSAQIFREMALTVTSSLLASLLIALSLVPMLSSKLLKRADDSTHHHFMEASKKGYTRLLRGALRHRFLVIIIVIIIAIGSVFGYAYIGFSLMPESDEGQISITANMPKGTTFNDTVNTVQTIEEALEGFEDIDVVSASVSDGNEGLMSLMEGGSDVGTINVVLESDRGKSTKEIADSIRDKVEPLVDCDLSIEAQQNNMMAMGSSPIAVNITGYDLDVMEDIANDIVGVLEDIDGPVEIDNGVEVGAPELKVTLDRVKGAPYMLTTAQVANQLQDTLNGINATKYKVNGSEIDVIVNIDRYKNMDYNIVQSIPISSPTEQTVPLEDIAEIDKSVGYSSINRENSVRMITVTSDLEEGYNVRNVTEVLKEELDDYEFPDGYNYEIGGMNEDIQESFESLGYAMLLGIVLIYMVMAAQFESFLYPFVIMFSVPLAFTGGFIGLFLTGNTLSIVAFLGMIILAGIVVNNGIVLVDYINKLKEKGKNTKDAIIEAGSVRLRPILMTALTTILALVPLLIGFGEGAEMQQPMAATVISGLVVSTLLTLFVIPVIYSLFDSIKNVLIKDIKE